MKHSRATQLNELKRLIGARELPSEAMEWAAWGGADVQIVRELDQASKDWVGSQPAVISAQKFQPQRRLVLTRFSSELSWLFCQLRDIYSGQLDYVSKYDFYGLLAQSALDYLDRTGDAETPTGLLLVVIEQAEEWHGGDLGDTVTAH